MLTDDDLRTIAAIWAAATPPPVATVMLPLTDDPVESFRASLSYSTQAQTYLVATGTPEGLMQGDEYLVTAYTGDGPTSHANADFYVMCHTAIPALIEEVRRLRREEAASLECSCGCQEEAK